MEHDHVREQRNLTIEDANPYCALATLKERTGYLPPCQRDANAFGDDTYLIRHEDPLPGRSLPPVDEELPPRSLCPTPYRWMLEESFRDICEDEELLMRGPSSPSPGTWVQEDDRQRALLDRFWGKLDRGVSLVFFYCNRGNAVDDTANRLIVGVSRLSDIGEPVYFGRSTKTPGRFPVWSRRITHLWPQEGVRIPYQEYINAGLDVESIACRPPRDLSLPFSYVAEHLSDGQAVSAILSISAIVEKLAADQAAGRGVAGDWAGALEWLNGVLDEVWAGRGAYPGLGALLGHLGYERGVAYHATVLRQLERAGTDPWQHLKSIFEGRTVPEREHAHGLTLAAAEWWKQRFSHKLLDLLVRFELTSDQFSGVANEASRKERGIQATNESIIENPYRLCEQDCGSGTSAAISLEIIDQGMLPEGDAARFRVDAPIARIDRRRVRAVMRAVLREAADAGDTIVPFETLMLQTAAYFPERRRCAPDPAVVWDSEDREFHEQLAWFKSVQAPDSWLRDEAPISMSDDPLLGELAELEEDLGATKTDSDAPPLVRLAALKSVRRCELEIAAVVTSQVGLLPDLPAEGPNWRAILTAPKSAGGFGEPESDREAEALAEKIVVLEALYRSRLSILTGGAGTGKTSVLRAFLHKLREIEGPRATLLTAPTGKARVKLQTSSDRPASTIHQVLWDAGMLGEKYRILDKPTKGQLSYSTVVIDESSMLSVELLAALFKAIKSGAITRLIFVGDTCQLPPIGPGRPFLDIIRWLRRTNPECVAELHTCMRVRRVDGLEVVSPGLQLANAYRDESAPGDDEIIARAACSGTVGDLTLLTWRDHEGLIAGLNQAMTMVGVPAEDKDAFDHSLGIGEKDSEKAENWQILSPTRIHAFGTAEINRLVQDRYRTEELSNATDPTSRWPRPMGDQGIVIRDKVMQIMNQPKWLPKDAQGMRFVANGEIGIVTNTWKRKGEEPADKAFVVFSTQPKASYRYWKGEVKECLELAYALTVHKAQGSDFGSIIVVLPRKARTLSRELFYTALTRFRDMVILLVEQDTAVLDRLRNADCSETARRSTYMFELLIGATAADIPLPDRYRPEGLIHRAEDGTPMRSKSEVIVYEVLKGLGVDPEYEQRLYAPGSEVDYCLPDFTLQHSGRTWYWEHLGMLDRRSYREDWERKKLWYHKHGYEDRLLTSRDHAGAPGGIVYADEILALARERILGLQ